MPWSVYILECCDGSLYTGVAKDLEHRLETHRSGQGSKYVHSRSPFKLAHVENRRNRSSALRREAQIKALTRPEKLQLIQKALPTVAKLRILNKK